MFIISKRYVFYELIGSDLIFKPSDLEDEGKPGSLLFFFFLLYAVTNTEMFAVLLMLGFWG